MYLDSVIDFQRSISKAQATPILGPLLISPAKALLSVAQIIVGLAASIIFGSIAAISLCFNQDVGRSHATESIGLVWTGTVSLMYAIGNMISLGGLGRKLESSEIR